MSGNRYFWLAAAFGCICLSGAAVWIGGLNQDEGWYLYAANLVSEGQRVYRDFSFTQGPVMPRVYSAFTWIWGNFGVLGARVLTLAIGILGIALSAVTAYNVAPVGRKEKAALAVCLLLGCNLYHLYYLAIPKTYALASLFVAAGFAALSVNRPLCVFAGGVLLALSAGVRLSLGAMLPVAAVAMLVARRHWILFGIGAVAGLCLAFGPVMADPQLWSGFVAAQLYHAARSGSDIVWVVGSLSRLVRWYLPVFVVFGLSIGASRRGLVMLCGFLAVFAVQMLAPFPYEDYQVPIMSLLAVYAAVNFVADARSGAVDRQLLLVLGLAYATSFGSPMLEKWTTNGQDRFWTLKKRQTELSQLRDVAKMIGRIDPGGKTLFTQDLYLAIETGRKVPKGLEMGPFSELSDTAWRELISSAPCPVAALSGYAFAIEPPSCRERSSDQQLEYWKLLRKKYRLSFVEKDFGQNATTLLILERK